MGYQPLVIKCAPSTKQTNTNTTILYAATSFLLLFDLHTHSSQVSSFYKLTLEHLQFLLPHQQLQYLLYKYLPPPSPLLLLPKQRFITTTCTSRLQLKLPSISTGWQGGANLLLKKWYVFMI